MARLAGDEKSQVLHGQAAGRSDVLWKIVAEPPDETITTPSIPPGTLGQDLQCERCCRVSSAVKVVSPSTAALLLLLEYDEEMNAVLRQYNM